MRRKGALYWLIFLVGLPILTFLILNSIFSPSVVICWISILPAVFIYMFWSMFGHIFRKPTKKLGWESESEEESARKRSSTEKYTTEDRTTKKDRGIFSRIFGSEETCDKCGSEMVYKEGAGSYYCPECKEYKWE